jgi:hypothetical protein
LLRPVHTYQHAGLDVEILYDDQTGSPLRRDRLGTVVGWAHPDIQLGEQQVDLEWTSPQEVVAKLKRRGARVILPLYYTSRGPQCSLDIGFDVDDDALNCSSGVVYVTAERIRDVFGVTRITATVLLKAQNQLGKEITEYNYFLENDRYGYVIRDQQKNVIARALGIPGLLECEAEANEVAEDCAKQKEAERLEAHLMACRGIQTIRASQGVTDATQ